MVRLWPKLVLLSAALLTARAEGAQPPVLLVTIDTLRADRVNAAARLTPAADALARDGIRFTRAMVQVPITLPSHVSILTGTFPMYHGIRDFGAFKLKEERETLAEILRVRGYATAAFVSSFALDSQWGLDQGFELYDDEYDFSGYTGVGFNAVERPGDETADRVLRWLEEDRSGPFFLWMHLFDPHDPYQPPEPYRSRHPHPYDAEVAFADAQLARVLDRLRELGLYDSTLILLMGDHGEGLGEHGEETHGFFVYNSTLHVPMIMKLPDNQSAGTRVDEVVQSVDVAPTVLQALRLPPGEEMQGRGLLRMVRGREAAESAAYGESLYARYHFGWGSLLSYQDDRYKYIRAPRPELYDLREDPGETRNRFSEESALGNQYDNLLEALSARFGNASVARSNETGQMDEETRQRLQSLGYVTLSAGSSGKESDSDRADPKDKVELFNQIRRATMDTEEGRLGASVRKLEAVIRRDPGIYSARYLQGFNFFQLRQFVRAVDEFKTALELFPDAPEALQSLAMSYFELGMNEASRLGFERLLRIQPGNPDALVGLGNLAMKERNVEEARRRYGRALESHPGNPRAQLGLGRVLVVEGQVNRAIDLFQEVARRFPRAHQPHELLALAYREKGLLSRALAHMAKARSLKRGRQ